MSLVELALVAQLLVWLAVLGVFLASGQASVFHPVTVYLGFHGLVFVARPFLVDFMTFDSVWKYMNYQPDDEVFVRTLVVTSVGLIIFVGTCLFWGWTRTEFSPQPTPAFSPLEGRALFWMTLILFPYVAASIATTQGGGEASGEHAENGIFIQTHSTGWLNDAQFMMAPLLCAWLVATRFHWLNLPLILLYVAYRSYTGWSRWTIVLFFLMVIFAYCWQQRRRWLPFWSLALAIPLLILFNILGHNRDVLKNFLMGNQEPTSEQRLGMSAEEIRNLRYDTQDFANFDYLCYVLGAVPERSGTYTYGRQYLQLFTEPIPRILWKGKPIGEPMPSINLNAYGNFIGLTVSLPGDGWMSGGWLGLTITMSLVGMILGWGHRWFWRKSDQPMAALFYVAALAMLPQWYRDGSISIAKFLMLSWLLFFVWSGLVWVLGGGWVRGNSVIIRSGTCVRIIQLNENAVRKLA